MRQSLLISPFEVIIQCSAAFLVFLEHLLGGTYFEVRCLTDSLSTEESIVPRIFPTKKKSKTIKRGV